MGNMVPVQLRATKRKNTFNMIFLQFNDISTFKKKSEDNFLNVIFIELYMLW